MREYLYNLATDREKGFIAGVIKSLLFILSLAYGLLLRVIIFLRRRRLYCLGAKVVSVGNITLGGTGKTVLVEYIARYLTQQGHRVAILTRGYKRKDTRRNIPPYRMGGYAADCGKTQDARYEGMGDEAYMLTQKLGDIPVVVDADRIKGAKKALRDYSADTLILDDGFQQWQIKKDLEIVTIDAQNPFGNKRIIPRGILREPLANLRRADIFMLTKTNFGLDLEALKVFLKSTNPTARIFESIHEPIGFFDFIHPQESINLAALKGKNIVLFCGIGNPGSFTALISSLGINIAAFFKFPDHYNYSAKDIDNIAQTAKEKNIDTIITTEKDVVRVLGICSASYAARFLFLRIKLNIINEQEFHNRLLGVYSR